MVELSLVVKSKPAGLMAINLQTVRDLFTQVQHVNSSVQL